MALEMVAWEVSKIFTVQGLLPRVFLRLEHDDLHIGEHSQGWWAVM